MRAMAKFLMLIVLTAAVDAKAKVCFLPGVLEGDGCIDNSSWSGSGCSSAYDQTEECADGYQSQTCIYNGTTYYRCYCRSDNFTSDQGGKYICTSGNFSDTCGCSASNVICNKTLYPYEGCSEYPNTTESTDSCLDPNDGTIWYMDCGCSETAYPMDCTETGLKAPTGVDYCEGTDGVRKYSFCICDDAWSTEECSSRTDGCTTLADKVWNGNDNCYLCSAETCSEENQVNLEAYWCDMSQHTVVDCTTLGYTQASECDDGSSGVKCPFDSSYIFCENAGGGVDETTCSEGYTEGITEDDCPQDENGCTMFIPDSSNDNCGMCHTFSGCTYCSEAACEEDTGNECSFTLYSFDSELNMAIPCYSSGVVD